VTFAALATGSPPLSYQWRKDGENIDGATGTSLEIASVSVADSGDYDEIIFFATSEIPYIGFRSVPPWLFEDVQAVPLAPKLIEKIEKKKAATSAAQPAVIMHANLGLTITDGHQPIPSTIKLDWSDELDWLDREDVIFDQTSDIVLSIPTDGVPFELSVSAPGFAVWTQTITLTESLDLVVVLKKES
jgi:hypothetical protein